MPPKKEVKEKVLKGDEADELVLQYLKSVNRPYASTDVSANLKNKVPKAAAQKVMQALADKGEITLKPYGKQTIFVYNQDKLPMMSSEDMAVLDEELKSAQDGLKEGKEELKELERNLAQAEALPETRDLPLETKRVEAENDMTLLALAPFRTNGDEPQVKPLSAEEIKQIDADFIKWRKQWLDRRKVYKEITGTFADGGVMINDEWREDQGITEDDEEAIALEQGEFCRPQVTARSAPSKSSASTRISAASTVVGSSPPTSTLLKPTLTSTPATNRSISSGTSEEAKPPKKKVKKA